MAGKGGNEGAARRDVGTKQRGEEICGGLGRDLEREKESERERER